MQSPSAAVLLALSACLSSFVLEVAVTRDAAGDEPTYFRRDSGLAAEKMSLPNNFDEDARLVWRSPQDPGNSTPCVVNGTIVLTTYDAEKEQLATVAVDAGSGKRRWRRVAPAARIEPFHPVGSPASCTPASDGKKVFVFFGSYGLLAYDLDGKLLWQKPMGPFQDEFGASSSPVLADGLIVLNEDHDVGSFVTAIDQETGRTVWKTDRPAATRSYSTPVIWNDGGDKQVVVAGSLQLVAYDLATGEKRWWVDGLSRIVDSTPASVGGRLFVATWTPGGDPANRISMESFPDALKEFDRDDDGLISKSELAEGPVLTRFFRIDLNQDEKLSESEWNAHARVFERAQNVAMAIRPEGEGDVTADSVQWTYRRGLPTVPSSVVYDGILYMVKDSGIVTSLDAGTGELLKQGRAAGPGNYYASLVAGDGKVFLCSERGVITVLKAGRDWEVLSSHDLGERIMATPVIRDGNIYVRTDAALYCFTKA